MQISLLISLLGKIRVTGIGFASWCVSNRILSPTFWILGCPLCSVSEDASHKGTRQFSLNHFRCLFQGSEWSFSLPSALLPVEPEATCNLQRWHATLAPTISSSRGGLDARLVCSVCPAEEPCSTPAQQEARKAASAQQGPLPLPLTSYLWGIHVFTSARRRVNLGGWICMHL